MELPLGSSFFMLPFIGCNDEVIQTDKQNGGRVCITEDMKRYF